MILVRLVTTMMPGGPFYFVVQDILHYVDYSGVLLVLLLGHTHMAWHSPAPSLNLVGVSQGS